MMLKSNISVRVLVDLMREFSWERAQPSSISCTQDIEEADEEGSNPSPRSGKGFEKCLSINRVESLHMTHIVPA